MVDVGCGIGGSSRYIVKKFGCTSRGITLSPKQAARANEVTARAGLSDKASFQVWGACGSVGSLGEQSFMTCADRPEKALS